MSIECPHDLTEARRLVTQLWSDNQDYRKRLDIALRALHFYSISTNHCDHIKVMGDNGLPQYSEAITIMIRDGGRIGRKALQDIEQLRKQRVAEEEEI